MIPADTTLEAARKQFELRDNARQNAIAGIKKLHPDFTDTQIKMELLRRIAGDELFREIIAAKGLK